MMHLISTIDWGSISSSLPSVFIGAIVSAAVYFIAASGLVVTYQTTGVFNMAHGAVGMLSAFMYWQLVNGDSNDDSPIAFLSPHLTSWVAALVIVAIFAPCIGALLEWGIFRRLAGATLATTLVVTVGLISAALTIASELFPSKSRSVRAFFGTTQLSVGGTTVTGQQLLSVGLAVVVAFGLWAMFHFSRIGIAMRAVVDNRSLAQLNGLPSNRIAMTSWMMGTMLAGLAGVLTAATLPLATTTLTLTVVNAYAAAIVGRLKSLPMTLVGALILAFGEVFIQKNLQFFFTNNATPPAWQNLTTVMPSVVLFIVLLVLPSERLVAKQPIGVRLEQPKPLVRFAIAIGFVALAACFAVFMIGDSRADLLQYGRALSIGLIVLSVVPLTGWGGQISLAQMMLAGVGAWCVTLWGANGSPLGMLGAIVVPAVVGVIVAIPALRLQGIYLALSTVAIAVFADKMFFVQEGVFRGGAVPVSAPDFGFWKPDTPTKYFIYMAVVFAGVGLILSALKTGSLGRRIAALRDAPAAAATLGMSTTRVKLVLFMISAAIAGLGGAVLAGMKGTAGSDDFEFLSAGLPILLIAVIGGISTVGGALVGGIFFAVIGVLTTKYPEYGWVFTLMPATIGISMASNPDGAVPSILRRIPFSSLGREERHQKMLRSGDAVPTDSAPVLVNTADEAEAAGIALGLEGVIANVSGR